VQVEPIEQRASKSSAVARNRRFSTAAAARAIAGVAAGARIHGGDELETRREFALPRGTRDGDAAGLERLAERLERGALELGELVEEQDTVMGERDLAGGRL